MNWSKTVCPNNNRSNFNFNFINRLKRYKNYLYHEVRLLKNMKHLNSTGDAAVILVMCIMIICLE